MRGTTLLPLAFAVLGLSALGTTTGCTARAGHARLGHPMLRDYSRGAEPGAPDAFSRRGPPPSDTAAAERARASIAGVAAEHVGRPQVVVGDMRFRRDCSGTVRGIYAAAGYPLGGRAIHPEENDVSIIHRWVGSVGSLRKTEPRVGDLVFFDDTYDRNGDGEANDRLSHIGVVEEILDDGTVIFVHRVSGGILRYRLNTDRPHLRRDPHSGQRLNHVLRGQSGDIAPATTGELFAGYGTVLSGEPPERIALR